MLSLEEKPEHMHYKTRGARGLGYDLWMHMNVHVATGKIKMCQLSLPTKEGTTFLKITKQTVCYLITVNITQEVEKTAKIFRRTNAATAEYKGVFLPIKSAIWPQRRLPARTPAI